MTYRRPTPTHCKGNRQAVRNAINELGLVATIRHYIRVLDTNDFSNNSGSWHSCQHKLRLVQRLYIRSQCGKDRKITRYESALEYILLLADKKDPHLGHPRLSDKQCVFCMTFFALYNGAYGYKIEENDYRTLIEQAKEIN